MTIRQDDLNNRFAFHPATTEEKRNEHTSIRMILQRAAEDVLAKLPPLAGREAAVVVTKLEEAMFWANAGLARHSE